MAAGQAGTTQPTRVRYTMLSLIAAGTLINYLDRTILGVAAPALTKELGISATVMGVIFSAFSWSYAAAQVPGGAFLDRFGTRLTYFLSVSFWSLFTLLQAFVGGVAGLIGLRLALGVAESPCFPANSRVVATWFPRDERAFATGVYTVGEYIGLAFLSPLLFAMLAVWGWRSLFVGAGVLGLLFALVWWRGYREPRESRANQAELDEIVAGGALLDQPARQRFDWSAAGRLLRTRQMWGICLGQFAGNSTLVFFLTWFPTYLATERQMDWLKIGFFAVAPFIAASFGVLFGGWWSDRMLRQGKSPNVARKLPIILGLLLASTIVAANFVESNAAVIAILSLAFFAQGMAALGWTLVSDLAPEGMLGVTGGVFNLAANLAGIVTPIVVGAIVAATGSFFYALGFIGIVALLGALSYIFILGDVRRIVLD
ncbi:MFS transporter, ACS family, D-galactonate transporter [Sphingomonas guangdongensis]|uniref:MFS transporter, ACS family, D-galactonate transporter n=1 Tax=Sphingomonas guangdongensis TaxID=1141890 RepID=A0A285Q989_9SPHN|nr:MFS transporter [Sphingomonas guangdongensis]SOB78500.1 MFS transporter, ACS family, D-galactonate transporter [Sphingomonas guangdongensis]